MAGGWSGEGVIVELKKGGHICEHLDLIITKDA
jgi:hypothetical protein